MRKFREPISRLQQTLLPRSVEEFVSEDDSVRYVDSLVDELDLSKIETKYSNIGRPGFNPYTIVKILIYGKIRGIRASRELSQACKENLKFIFLSNGEKPDFRTISLFRKRFSKELSGILRQTIVIGLETGAISLEHVAIDGSLVRSFAGINSYKTPEKICEELSKLEQLIEEDIKIDELEKDSCILKKLPKSLNGLEERKKRLREALKKQDSFDSLRKKDRPKKISITDPDSRYSRKGPAYNAQVGVDEDSRMAVGGFITDAVSDNGQLIPMLAKIEENTGENPKKVSADTGYNAKENLGELERRSIDGYIPQRKNNYSTYPIEKFNYNERDNTYICPNDKKLKYKYKDKDTLIYIANVEDCQSCPLRAKCLKYSDKKSSKRSLRRSIYDSLCQKMKAKTKSEEGKKMAKKRSCTVETVFGHIKYARKLRQFIYRGMNMVNDMWQFELGVYNLEQLIRLNRKGVISLS